MSALTPVYLRISEQDELPGLDGYGYFRAVVVLDAPYSDQWQDKVSRWLVEGGCLYMMAWGPDCSSWDDSVDYAQTQKYLPGEAPDDQIVMTTWHDNETLEDVFWYSQFCAFDPYDTIAHTLILHISGTDKRAELLKLFEEAYTLAEREGDQA